MDDLISRAAAIEAAFKDADEWEGGFNPKHLRAVPSVDAVPVIHGRWVDKKWTTEDDWGCINHTSIICTACNNEVYHGMKSPYCPNCGAKMDADQHLAYADQSGAKYADNPTV